MLYEAFRSLANLEVLVCDECGSDVPKGTWKRVGKWEKRFCSFECKNAYLEKHP